MSPVPSGLPNGVRLSCGADLDRSQIEDYPQKRGAGSFRRVLGSALFSRRSSSRRPSFFSLVKPQGSYEPSTRLSPKPTDKTFWFHLLAAGVPAGAWSVPIPPCVYATRGLST